MQISPIDIAVIAIYLLATLGLGLYQTRKIRTSGDYYAGGRKFNKFYLMMHALGTATHADEPLSVIGGSYQKGIAGIWYTYLFLPLTPIFWLIAPYVRRSRFVTLADFFRYRYDASLAILYSVIGVLKMSVSIGLILKSTATLVGAMATGGIAAAGVAETARRAEVWSILVMTLVFVTYGFAGGLRATVITETIQGPLIVLMSLLLLPFGIYKIGGFHALHQALPASHFQLSSTGFEFTPRWIIASSLVALIGWVAQPGIVAAVGSGKTELEGRVGYTYGAMIKRVCAIGWTFTGVILAAMAVKQMLPPEQIKSLAVRERAFGTAIAQFFPHGLLGLTFAAIFSAQMATLSAQMVNSSALAAKNLYKGVIKPHASDQEVLIVGRICGIFLVAIGVGLALQLEKVADALTMLLQFSAVMGVVVWGGVLWRRANSPGAWTAVIVLFLIWAILGQPGNLIRKNIGGPLWLGRFGAAEYMFELTVSYLPAGILTLIVVSLFTKPPPAKQVNDFRMLLKTPVGHEQKLIDAGVPIIYAGSTQPNSLEINHPLMVHWGGAALAALVSALILVLLLILAHIGSTVI
jgi:Na+/proline symporter